MHDYIIASLAARRRPDPPGRAAHDVSDPAAMTVARTLTVPGAYVSVRLTGGTVRVVLIVDGAQGAKPPGLSAFVPRSVLRSRITRRTFDRPLARCREIRRTARFSGLDLLTILPV